ncbi:hypothetical protein AC739_12355 [Planococcus glaciei]|uniref:hypothetical protein n=1 Tax=Planococcus glaciei TaxID=459472 RepID=UPI00069F3B94|nr:hypothetical protein [Planococcus glaciei]KOF09879.1 hypothetical protein AC739_12355 [Planococcus glaciei]
MIIEETNKLKNTILLPEIQELEKLLSRLTGDEAAMLKKVLEAINKAQKEMKNKNQQIDELASFFGNWAKAFESIIQTPVNLNSDEHVRIHYSSTRNSIRNLVNSCQEKIEEYENNKLQILKAQFALASEPNI